MKVEVCINSDGEQSLFDAVNAAYMGGATTVELCSAMHVDGLTPAEKDIKTAREAFQDRPGLMVMIRPRSGDFHYSQQEIELMRQQIHIAAQAGANGVVFGVLEKPGNHIAIDSLANLVQTSKKYNLKTTFHRAFDAAPNPTDSLGILVTAGVDRILTSGTVWTERKPATDGLANLRQLIKKANDRIEIVIGGGVNPRNVSKILSGLPQNTGISFHAYTGVQENGFVTWSSVKQLVTAVV